MKKNTIISLTILLAIISVFSGLYMKRKIADNKATKESLLVMNLNQEALQYTKKYITAIDKGDYIKMSEMMKVEPEDYKHFGEVRMKYVDMQLMKEISNSSDLVAEYILKFQNSDIENQGEKKGFIFVNGFYYLNVMVAKDKGDGWRVASISTRGYFN